MKKVLPIILLLTNGAALAQGLQPIRLKETVADFPRSQLQLKTDGPVSMQVNAGNRAAYTKLAEIAGLNIVFDPDFRDAASQSFTIENTDVLQAFDVLSSRTGSFVEVLNSNTIIVSPDNQTKRRNYEVEVLKTFYLPNSTTPQRLTEIITTLRATLQARYIFTSPTANAITMRDTPNRVAAAEKIISLSMPLVAGASAATVGELIGSGHILTLEAGNVQDSALGRSGLRLSGRGPVSFYLQDSTRALFERLARSAGLNVIFDSDFRSLDGHSFNIANIEILDAIDVLALQTRNFWEPVDSTTILVAPDNQTKRREFENVFVKTFYLPNVSQVEMVEIVTALRTLLNARYLTSVAHSNMIVMRDNANRLVLAERIISDLRKAGGVVSAAGFPAGTIGGFVLNRRAAEKVGAPSLPIQPRIRGPVSFDAYDTARATYEAVAATAGLRIVFDSRFQDAAAAPFKLQNVGIVDALDYLALQTRTIWQIIDQDTLLVAPDNQSVRADLPKVTKTISLTTRAGNPRNIDEVVTALRTILTVRQMSALDNSIVMTDTAENIAFSEKMVIDLDTPAR